MEELDLKEIFNIFWNKKAQILIITFIFMIIGAVYSYVFVQPDYESFTKLVLAKTESASATNSTSASITQSDITLNQKLISTYSELVESNSVLRKVINNLSIEGLTEENLKKAVTVTAVKDADLLQITVRNRNPQYAAMIANEIAKAFIEEVTRIYQISNITVLDQAEIADGPYNINHPKDILLFALAGIVVASLYVLVANMLDTTVKDAESLEKMTGLLVLAQIPEYDFEGRMRGKK